MKIDVDILERVWFNSFKNGDDMICWFMKKKRGRKDVLLLGVPMMVLAFVLLIMAGSTQSSEQAENSNDGMFEAYGEVFSAINPVDPADVYIQWDLPKAATGSEQADSASSGWFLGAYKGVPENGRTDASLCVALDRTKLLANNNLECAIHYFDADLYLFIDLLDANGLAKAENIYGNLLTGSGEDKIINLRVPLVDYPDAAAIQLRYDEKNTAVYESRIYVGESEGRLAVVQESCNSESGHGKEVNEFGLIASGSYPAVATQTTAGNDNLKEAEQDKPSQDNAVATSILNNTGNILFVDQIVGDDQFSGRLPVVSGQDGPKRTIRNGLAAAEGKNTLVIKSGAYNEDLDIRNIKNLEVVIEGDVKL